MAGFYTLADIRAFLAARREAHAQLNCAPNAHLTLNDIRGMSGQPATIVDAFTDMLADPEYRSRRLAFVVGANLARHQVMRALDNRIARVFADPEAAEAWLLSEDSEAAPLRATG